MSRRALTLLVASLLVLILAVVGAILPVPYVVLQPGPTINTLGTFRGRPIIQVQGHRTFPATGHLDLVTVAYQGGPGNPIDLFTALRAWFDPESAVVPEETLFPPNQSARQVEQDNVREMTDSQAMATAAALRELKIPYRTVVSVAEVRPNTPAARALRVGDVIIAVDGTAVTGPSAAADRIGARPPGRKVTLTVQRAGRTFPVTLPTVAGGDGRAVVGVVVEPKFQFPFTVKINVGDIGGPSAGMMFALGLIDKLTTGDLTGGRFIAGTGTIDPSGQVGPIGGIQQKMAGARAQGATIFLTPAANCKDALADVPKGLRLVKVETLDGALQALRAIRTGHGTVPTCTR